MTGWLLAPVLVPLTAAALAALGRRSQLLQRGLAVASVAVVVAAGAALLTATTTGRIPVTALGGWPNRFAIVFAADPLAALLVTTTGVVALAVLGAAVGTAEDGHPFFHPLVLVFIAGVCGSFLTADLFNLFVFFEVALTASYVLATLAATRRQVRAGAVYIATNLAGSLLLVTGVAWTYAAAGTVNLADFAGGAGRLPAVAGAVLLVAFGVKAAAFPLGGWLAVTYPDLPRSIAALFGGLLTTVGVVALYRILALALHARLRTPLLAVATATIVVGALAALGRRAPDEILAFQVIAQVGFMILGAGLFGPAGLAAGVFFVVQDMVVKTAAFLSLGGARDVTGHDAGATLERARPVLAFAFFLVVLSFAGLPPTSGFVGKLLLIRAAFAGAQYAVAALALVGSLATLAALLRAWRITFTAPRQEAPEPSTGPGPRRMRIAGAAPAATLAVLALAVGMFPAGLAEHAQRSAAWLVAPDRYAAAVLE
ncbi:MAG TPA: proton-conducting transporter membrane subunit [Nitriliruptorales bacterium]|nr:proton-conducting transporter membrane subunit [Nitriliruptorales bacterium]